MNIVPKKLEKINKLSKQQCKSQMNTKIAKKNSKIKLPPLWGHVKKSMNHILLSS